MLLKISHRTSYDYDVPVQYALQRLRLFPGSGPTQSVRSWSLDIEGASEQLQFFDQFGNDTRLVSVEGEPVSTVIAVRGEVETTGTSGIVGPHAGFAPLWLFLSETALTAAGPNIRGLAESVGEGDDLERLHRLMALIGQKVRYQTGATEAETTGEEAMEQGSGVCQDHAHVLLSAARLLGFPARYVSGYLMMNETIEQVASHAWAEVHIDALGWVAFDAANGVSADERYVRIATGRDYRDAMPVSGIRLGAANERLAVHITVEQ